jgi:hypothetical protein
MKLFEDLDKIISRAVFESMKDEKLIQKNQSSVIDKLDLRASDQNSLDSSVKEAEADEETEIKITGDAEKKPDKKKSNPEEKGTAASKKLKDLSNKQISKPTFRSIADNINLLRGGRSIKDPEVKQNLKDYLSRLDVQEKRQVLIYLNSLAQVMSGVKLGSEVAVDTGQAETKADKKHKTGSSKRSSEVIVVGE